MNYRADLDGIRAIAIVLVLAGHLLPEWVPGGFIGVDVFFVLSGYLITGIALSKRRTHSFRVIDFYSARVRRLMPALLLLLITVLCAGWFLLLPLEYRSLARHARASLGFFENYQLARETGYFDRAVVLKPFAHLWSLSIEEQFYLLFPGLIWLSGRGRVRRVFWLVALFVTSVLMMLWLSEGGQAPRAYLDPLARVWALLAGSGLSILHDLCPFSRFKQKRVIFQFMGVIGFLGVLGSAFFIQPSERYPGWRSLGVVGGTLLLVGWGRKASSVRPVLEHPLVGYIGKISYPLYLWHWSLISFCTLSFGAVLDLSERFLILAVALILSMVTYHAVEQPIRRSPASARMSVGLLVGALLLVFAAQRIVDLKGIPSRWPDLVQLESDSFPESWRVGRCLLSGRQPPAALDPVCLASSSHPRVLLWGDSFAAHLVPGVTPHLGTETGLSVMTMMACFPGFSAESANAPQCPQFYEAVMAEIRRHAYDRIILAANWEKYPEYWVFERLQTTIRQVRALGVNDIVLVGPPPRWQLPLPRLVFLDFLRTGRLPERLKDPLQSRTRHFDQRLFQASQALQVDYLSIFSRFCGAEGCEAQRGGAILSLDEEHLTPEGARWLFQAPMRILP